MSYAFYKTGIWDLRRVCMQFDSRITSIQLLSSDDRVLGGGAYLEVTGYPRVLQYVDVPTHFAGRNSSTSWQLLEKFGDQFVVNSSAGIDCQGVCTHRRICLSIPFVCSIS